MKKGRGDKERLQHIILAIHELEVYTVDLTKEVFIQNSLVRSACAFQIEIIGEASNHLSNELLEKYNQINWREIIGLRNLIAHEYFGIDYVIIWEIITVDLPILNKQIELILSEL